tara:strand:- start:93 stop:407 length:315 start_codon:yes stop_codon:yes gene_type:complete
MPNSKLPRSKRPRIWGNAVMEFLVSQKTKDSDDEMEYKFMSVDYILHGTKFNSGKRLSASKHCPNISQLSRFLRLNKNVERNKFMQKGLTHSTYNKFVYRYKGE